jgi:ABC-type glycerol-3-phosphate transport system permease component
MLEARSRKAQVVLQVLATLIIIPFVLPLVAMVQGSLAGSGWGNYKTVLTVPNLATFFKNSALLAIATISIVYVCTMTAAFGFAKLRIRGKEVYFWLVIAALTLPEIVLLSPLFSTAVRFGLYGTLWAIIVPLAALQIPFTLLIARNFVDGIPDQLFEAARVDGAGVVRVFWSIVLPLTRPIAATVIVMTLITAWNDYLLPLVFLPDPSVQTITLIPQYFIGQFNNDQTKVLASAVITVIPEVFVYLCFQRVFERGLSAGVLK